MEQTVAAALELIPRTVRDKLDGIGIKLHLKDWQALSLAERQQLCDWPCDAPEERARFAAEVEHLVLHATGKLPDRLTKKDPSSRVP